MAGNEDGNGTMTIADLAKAWTPEQVFRAARRGKIREGVRMDPERVADALADLDDIIPAHPQQSEFNVREGYRILRVKDPARNVTYVTLVVNGQALTTRTPEGELDYSCMHSSESALLEEVVRAGLPGEVHVKIGRKGTGKGKSRGRGGGGPRHQFAFDPLLVEFFHESGEAIVFDALEGSTAAAGDSAVSAEDLEAILEPTLFRELHERGYHLRAQGIANYVASCRTRIGELRRAYLSEYVQNDAVTRLISEFMREHRTVLPEMLKRTPSSLEVYKDAKAVYEWFQGKDPDDKVSHIVDGLRYTLIHMTIAKAAREEYTAMRQATAKWLSHAKAADLVLEDDEIQEEILPLFRANRSEDAKFGERDVNFDVISRLGRRVIAPGYRLDSSMFKMMVRGLWMFGYLGRAAKGDSLEAGQRTGHGVRVEYIDPMSHYLQRRHGYDAAMFGAFDELVRAGQIDGSLALRTSIQCEMLGRKLYGAIEDREKIFTHLHRDQALKEGGSHLNRILRAQVGVHREGYLEKVEQRSGSDV